MTSPQRRLVAAVESSDVDELLRIVDGLVAARDWEGVLEVRARCQEATVRGKQLWGVDEHCRYRMALEGPPQLATAAVDEGPARFALGPLPEVAAQAHSWAELEPYLSPGPGRTMVAHERVLRGEDLRGAEGIDPRVLELPLQLQPWEPSYPLARYRSDRLEAEAPDLPRMDPVAAAAGQIVEDPAAIEGLLALVQPWVDESNGRATAVAVEGHAAAAVAALGVASPLMRRVGSGEALSWMGWAGASGGAYGRRRGAAVGRFGAWWALAALLDLDWPPPLEAMAAELERLEWFLWSDRSPGTGWVLRLAVEDPAEGLAWALGAVDAA